VLVIKRAVKRYIEVLILAMLRERELHGYGFMRVLRERCGVKPSPAVIYPVLKSLEKSGFIQSTVKYMGGRRVTVYSVTEKGLEYLRENEQLLEEALSYCRKLKIAADTGLLDMLRAVRALFAKLEKLDERDLAVVRDAARSFTRAVAGIAGGVEHE